MDNITYLDVPEMERGFPLPAWRRTEVENRRRDVNDPERVYFVGEVRHWRSNDAVVPLSVFREGYMVPCEAHVAAYEADVARSLEAYRKARENYISSANSSFTINTPMISTNITSSTNTITFPFGLINSNFDFT